MKKRLRAEGTYDILPNDYLKFEAIFQEFKDHSFYHYFKFIKVPTVEIPYLYGSNHKEIFTFKDKGGNYLALRKCLGRSVIRTIFEKKLYLDPSLPLKFAFCGDTYSFDFSKNEDKKNKLNFGWLYFGEKSLINEFEMIIVSFRMLRSLDIENPFLIVSKNESSPFFSFLDNNNINYKKDERVKRSTYEIAAKENEKTYVLGKSFSYRQFIKSYFKRDFYARVLTFNVEIIFNYMEENSLFEMIQSIDEVLIYYSKQDDEQIFDLYNFFIQRDIRAKLVYNKPRLQPGGILHLFVDESKKSNKGIYKYKINNKYFEEKLEDIEYRVKNIRERVDEYNEKISQ